MPDHLISLLEQKGQITSQGETHRITSLGARVLTLDRRCSGTGPSPIAKQVDKICIPVPSLCTAR